MTDTKSLNRYWGTKTPPKTKAEFFNAITAPAPDGEATVATIRLYGPIDSWGGWWGINTKDVSDILDALPDTVTEVILRINSPGGHVFEGVSILNMLRAHKARIVAVVDGLAASAASIIAAGCDETVMSPGTSMMIHSPLTFTYGNAAELRKEAEVLDSIERSMIEIYQAKAGDADWETLLHEETWYTPAEAVAQGLADRVGTVADAGTTSTAGEDDVVIVVTPAEEDDDVEDSTRVHRFAAKTMPTNKTPVSSEPGTPNRKEDVMAYDDLQAGLRARLGITDAEATDEQLLAGVEQLTARAAVTTPPAIPEGVQMIDSSVLENLQQQAAQGAQALAAQTEQRRAGIISTALAEGRIAPTSVENFRAMLESNEETTVALINQLPKNSVVPVLETGHADTAPDADAALAAAAGWTNTSNGE